MQKKDSSENRSKTQNVDDTDKKLHALRIYL
jgi:hypothetical protein